MKKTLIAALAVLSIPAFAGKPVTIKGSDTMVIMNARLAEAFMAKEPAALIQVTGGGSGVGIASLINGTADIAASSRPIKASETDSSRRDSRRSATHIRSRATGCRSI
jgi:phosphate transport system substrate-binding protein